MREACYEDTGDEPAGRGDISVGSDSEAGKNEVLLKLLYGGICGSDLSAYRGTFAYFDYPRVPGHEFSAEIVEVGENSYGLKKGMVVTYNPYFNCGSCYSCRRGVIPERGFFPKLWR